MKSETSKKRKTSQEVRKMKKRKIVKERRNWLELPPDVMIHIFLKLGVIDILFTAQRVCSPWRKLAKEPQLFRCIDMRNHWHVFGGHDYFEEYAKMARDAFNRCGELVEFSMEYFGTDELIHIAIEKSKSLLKCLRLVSCYQVNDDAFIEITKKNPLLEELELVRCSFDTETIAVVGRTCLQLKSFRLNGYGSKLSDSHIARDSDDDDGFNEEAFTIANNMPQLRRLDLFANSMDNKGLQAILDKCPHLEYLDLRQCYRLDLKEDLLKRCVDRISDLRLPMDSTHDYEYDDGHNDEEPQSYQSDDGCYWGF